MKTNENKIYYGVNIDCDVLNDGTRTFARYNTYDSYDDALTAYDILSQQNEPKLWENVDIEEIIPNNATGDYNYLVLKSTKSDRFMDDREYWGKIKNKFSIIHDFSICEDMDSDGRIINICWLAIGYMSPSSGYGYFHYSTIEEFQQLLSEVKHIKQCNSHEIGEYLLWLSDNECLFEKDERDLPSCLRKIGMILSV